MYAQHLTEFAQHTFKQGIPLDVQETVLNLICDQVGLQIGCAKLPWSQAVYESVGQFPARGAATVVFYGDQLSPEQTAFVNASFGHGQDFDDTHTTVQTHPGSVIIPTALAMGEEVHATGNDIVRAIAVGLEVMLRIAHAISPYCLQKGHHTPPTVGPFGAAITAGLLLGLNREQLINALGIAGSFAGGLLEYTQSGGSVKRIHTAIPSQAGIKAAHLASQGLTGPSTILEGNRGVCRVFADDYVPERMTMCLGEEYLVTTLSLKAYNCCYFIHAPLEALLSLQRTHAFQSEDVQHIAVGTSAYSTTHVGQIPEPQDPLGAQFSMHFTLALSLLNQPPGIADYTAEQLSDPRIRTLARKIRVYEDPTASQEYPENWGGVVTVTTTENTQYTQRVRHVKGSPENPMTPADIKTKFLNNVTQSLDTAQAIALFTQIQNLPHTSTIATLMQETVPHHIYKAAPFAHAETF